jgi:Fe-S-cluster-containing dehydrogenase component
MTKLGFLVNLEMCSDHRGCMISCKNAKNSPLGNYYIETFTAVDDAFPDVTTYFIPVMCQHCENPSCVGVCGASVFTKLPNGAVAVGDTSVCATCEDKPCLDACPYHAISLDKTTGRVGKCDMCLDRLAEGKPPACMENCFCGAIMFGDMDDPESQISTMMGTFAPILHQLKPDSGNNPSVYYALSGKPWKANMDGLYSPAWKDE